MLMSYVSQSKVEAILYGSKLLALSKNEILQFEFPQQMHNPSQSTELEVELPLDVSSTTSFNTLKSRALG